MSKYFYLFKTKIWSLFYSFFFVVKLALLGIPHGSKIRTFGKTYIFKQKNSTIIIGDSCDFRSKEHSNLIGINRKCSLSTLIPGAKIIIGNNCGFSGSIIGSFKSIQFGDNVRCGANTLITDSDWHNDDPRSGEPASIYIEDNVWLGEGVKVLKGVTIGKNSVIGLGSIVTKNIPANVVAAGNPCKVIKPI